MTEPDALRPPDPARERAERTYAALFRIQERYAATEEARARLVNPHGLSPQEAVRLVASLGAGAVHYVDDAEPQVQDADLVAALTLLPLVRSELDELELALLRMARGEGMTWAQIAFGLGMGSAQAAQQRHDRLAARTRP